MIGPLRRWWHANRPLTAVGLLMMALAVVSLAAMALDPRTILEAPAWLKPTKFAVAIGTFCLTMAWALEQLPGWRRLRDVVSWTTAVVFVVELVLIDLQAWRGTTSHFNVATTFDAAVFGVMGLGIVGQTVASVAVAIAMWRHRFDDRLMGWALRLGLTISIAGASTGILMTEPTPARRAELRAAGYVTVTGAHSIGGFDGGPGLPGVGWSIEHGDLRVPHFVGLHAFQALPLAAWLIRRRGLAGAAAFRLLLAAGASYAALFAILLWQALRGQSLARPDGMTTVVAVAWAVLSLVLLARLSTTSRPGEREITA